MNLSQIFNQEHKKEEGEFPFPLQSFGGEKIKEASPLFLSIENIGKGKVEIRGHCELTFSLPCDRCLSPVEFKLPLDFAREAYAPGYGNDEAREEQLFLDEYELNLEMLVSEELSLCWPAKVLCDEECRGICPKCGQNRNEGSCECDDFVPDIRFANLMDIFEGKE